MTGLRTLNSNEAPFAGAIQETEGQINTGYKEKEMKFQLRQFSIAIILVLLVSFFPLADASAAMPSELVSVSGSRPTLRSNPAFGFSVTHTDNLALGMAHLADHVIGLLHLGQSFTAACADGASLNPSERFTFYGSLAWQPGQHENTATVSGSYEDHPKTDGDKAHYFGASASIDVEKSIWDGSARDDADTGDGPTLLSGSDPIFKFDVTNTSNVALTNIVREDNPISFLYSEQSLNSGCVEPVSFSVSASFICFGTLPWAAGKHENEAAFSAEANKAPAINDSDLAFILADLPKYH